MPEDPTKSRILNEAERRTALARIDADQVIKTGGQKEKFKWKLLPLVFNPIVCLSILHRNTMLSERLDLHHLHPVRLHEYDGSRSRSVPAFCYPSTYVDPVYCPAFWLTVAVRFLEGTFTVVQIQLRTIPPNVAGTIWAVLSLTLSGRIKRRYPIFFANAILFLVASCINLATLNPKARFVMKLDFDSSL